MGFNKKVVLQAAEMISYTRSRRAIINCNYIDASNTSIKKKKMCLQKGVGNTCFGIERHISAACHSSKEEEGMAHGSYSISVME